MADRHPAGRVPSRQSWRVKAKTPTAVMAADLASQPNSGLEVQLCGDAHVLNFGLWATPERNLMFDLRDFDGAAAPLGADGTLRGEPATAFERRGN